MSDWVRGNVVWRPAE